MNSAPEMQKNNVTHEKMMEFEPLLDAREYQPDTWRMPMPLPGTDSVVTGAFEPLLDMGRGRNLASRVT